MNVGDRIKQRRLKLGLTVDDLADKIGKSRATIYRYENGDIESMPTVILEPLAKALDTTPADLMGWDDSRITSNSAAMKNICCKTKDETELVLAYRELTDFNKKKSLSYTKTLLSTQKMEDELMVQAANARTDIEHTPEGKAHDDAIMDDDSGWE